MRETSFKIKKKATNDLIILIRSRKSLKLCNLIGNTHLIETFSKFSDVFVNLIILHLSSSV